LLVYVCWLTFEIVFIFFLFPETANRTLEELAFSKFSSHHRLISLLTPFVVFEGKEKAEQVAAAVEKNIQQDDDNTYAPKATGASVDQIERKAV